MDEFHRCGAEEGEEGAQKLLTVYPTAALVGLTAMNIRYLDNQRDIANELFDGCVAHHMTLGSNRDTWLQKNMQRNTIIWMCL